MCVKMATNNFDESELPYKNLMMALSGGLVTLQNRIRKKQSGGKPGQQNLILNYDCSNKNIRV